MTAQGRERRYTSAESLLQWSWCFSRSVGIIRNPRPAHRQTDGRGSGCNFRGGTTFTLHTYHVALHPIISEFAINITWECKPGAALLFLFLFFLYFYEFVQVKSTGQTKGLRAVFAEAVLMEVVGGSCYTAQYFKR